MAITSKITQNQLELNPANPYAITAEDIYYNSTQTIKQYIDNFTVTVALDSIMYDPTTTLRQYLQTLEGTVDNLSASDISYSSSNVGNYLDNLDATQISYNGGSLDTFLDTINLTPGNLNTSQILHGTTYLNTYLNNLNTSQITYDSTNTLQEYLNSISSPSATWPVDYVFKAAQASQSPYSPLTTYYINTISNDIFNVIENIDSTNRKFILFNYDSFLNTNARMTDLYTIYHSQTRIDHYTYSSNYTLQNVSTNWSTNIETPAIPANPSLNSFITPTTPGPSIRRFHAVSSFYNFIVISGGDDGVIYHQLTDNWCYNPHINEWMQLASLSTGRRQHTITNVNNLLYLFGGYGGTPGSPACGLMGSLCQYDPWNNVMSPITPINTSPSARIGHIACSYNNKLYIFGGYDGTNYYNDLWEYNPLTNAWQQISTSGTPGQRSDHFAVIHNGELYVSGGTYNDGTTQTYYSDIIKYSFATNQWSTVTAALPSSRSSATMNVYDNKLYIFGGYDGTNYYNNFIVYDLLSNTISSIPTSLPTISDHTSLSIYEKLYIFGGYSSTTGYSRNFLIYDIPTNTWKDMTT